MANPRIKNQVVIILDTDAPNPIQIGKVEAAPPPTAGALAEAIKLDFSTVREAMLVLIKEMDRMGVQNKDTTIKDIVNTLNEEFPGVLTVEP